MRASAPCLLAAFGSAVMLERARSALHGAGIRSLETYTPTPASDQDHASAPGVTGAVAGLIGFAGAFALQVYANLWGYPLDIGGRPKFSWPSFTPIALEVGILLAALGIFICVFISAPLLRLYAPIDDRRTLRRASTDRWVIVINAQDSLEIARARDICLNLGALEIEEPR